MLRVLYFLKINSFYSKNDKPELVEDRHKTYFQNVSLCLD